MMCLYSPEEPVGSKCVELGRLVESLPGKTVIMNEKESESVDLRQMLPASALWCFLSQHRLSSLSSRMGWTFSRTVSPDCRIISTISSLFLFSTFRPFISTSRSPGTKPRARSLVPAPGSAKWTTRRYTPSISATVPTCGAPQGEPKIPSVPPLRTSSRTSGVCGGTTAGKQRSAGNVLSTISESAPFFAVEGCLLMMLKTWLTLGVKDLVSTCGDGAAEFCPEGVEPSDGLSSLFLWEMRKRFMMEPICEFCMARGADLAARLLAWQDSGGHLDRNRPSDRHWNWSRTSWSASRTMLLRFTEAVRLNVGQVELSAAGDFNRYRVRDLQLVLGVPFGAPVEV